MSDPATPEEHAQAAAATVQAEEDELLVSTACPGCGTRFALLVHTTLQAKPLGSFSLSGNQIKFPAQRVNMLRCTVCPWTGVGSLKAED